MSERNLMRTKSLRIALIFGLCVALSGCTTLFSYRSGGETADQASDAAATGAVGVRGTIALVGRLFRRPPPQQRPEQFFTAEVLAQSTSPILVLFFEDDAGGFGPTAPWASFAEAGFNGDVTTWVEGSARTISVSRLGLLRSTRGFGRDVLTTDTAALEAVLSGRALGAERALRVHRTLDGENDVVIHSLLCGVQAAGTEGIQLITGTFATLRVDENCLSVDGTEILNRYWIDLNGGLIRQSEQWVSPEIGQVRLQRLR